MRGAWAAFAFVALVGCGQTELHEVVFRTAPPTGRPVDVYLEGQTVETPIDDLALLQVMASGNASGTEPVIAALRNRAAVLGCDVLVRVRVVNGASGTHGFGVCARRVTAAP